MEDKKLINLILTRPSQGLEEALRQYGGLVKTIVSRVLYRYPQDIEECVLDTFTKLWHAREKIASESPCLRAYLICIARNTAINRYHQLNRQYAVSMDDMVLEISSDEDISDTVLDNETAEYLLEILHETKEPDKTIMMRRYFLFEPIKEIAHKLGLTANQVKNRIQYTKKLLRKQLEKGGIGIET